MSYRLPVEQIPSQLDRTASVDYSNAAQLREIGGMNGTTLPAEPYDFLRSVELREPRIVNLFGRPRVQSTGIYNDPEGDVLELRVTEPGALDTRTPDIMCLLGWTEVATKGTGAQLHNAIAANHPGSRTVTVASDGLNTHGTRLPIMESLTRDWNDAAAPRLRLGRELQEYSDGQPMRIAAESWGSRIAVEMLHSNLEKSQLDVDSVVIHSGALVERDSTPVAMLVKFPLHMVTDLGYEMVHHPLQVAKCAEPRPDLLSPRVLAALIGQAGHLLAGVDYAQLDEVANNYRMGFVSGNKDPLHIHSVLDRLKADHKATVRVHENSNGHASALDARGAGRHISDMYRQLCGLTAPGTNKSNEEHPVLPLIS